MANEPPIPERRRGSNTALWAGLTALFTNLVAVKIVNLIATDPSQSDQAIAAVASSLAIGAAVYSKTRWDEARALEKRNGNGQ